MSSEFEAQQAARDYQAGKTSFERGRYREAVASLLRAVAGVNQGSVLGGEIQIWLVTAYEAAGERQSAIALCRELQTHPDLETRKQSRRLLYILEAPQLQRRPEWLTQIPELSDRTEVELKQRWGSSATAPARPARPVAKPDPIDFSQVNTQDNGFVWLALLAIAMILGGLFWLS